jgi:transposase
MSDHRTVVAVDLAKTVFELAVSQNPGEVACTRRLYWAREIQALGHAVELIPPHLVLPYVTRNKTKASLRRSAC